MPFLGIFFLFDGFVGHPGRMWCVAAGLGVLFVLARLAKTRYSLIRALPLLIVSLLWLASGFAEREALRERANIRVDLLLIDPVLFFGTILAIILCLDSVYRALRTNEGQPLDLRGR